MERTVRFSKWRSIFIFFWKGVRLSLPKSKLFNENCVVSPFWKPIDCKDWLGMQANMSTDPCGIFFDWLFENSFFTQERLLISQKRVYPKFSSGAKSTKIHGFRSKFQNSTEIVLVEFYRNRYQNKNLGLYMQEKF